MVDPWIWAVGAVLVGLLSGMVGAALVRLAILKGRENRPEALDAARATAIFVFLFFAAVGVVVAVGVTNRETLRPIPAELLAYSPHVLASGLILIAGRAMAYAAASFVKGAMADSVSRMRVKLAESVRVVITLAAAVLALRQLGVDTTILNIVIAALLCGLAAAFALLVGLGGRDLARELAIGRYVGRLVRVGDEIEIDDVSGVVVGMHPASVEVMLADGASVHVRNSEVFASRPRVTEPSVARRPGDTEPSVARRPGNTEPSVARRPGNTEPSAARRPGNTEPSVARRPGNTEPSAARRGTAP